MRARLIHGPCRVEQHWLSRCASGAHGASMHLSTVEARLEYRVREPSHCCFNVEAAHWPSQTIVSEQLTIEPPVPVHAFTDQRSGNRYLRFDASPGPLLVHYKADVEVHTVEPPADLPQVPVAEVPDLLLGDLLPTRYCESDLLGPFAREQFGRLPPGIARVRRVVDWVRENIAYVPGSTNSSSTAHDVLQQRKGVCRDFAHVAITLCRALNVPARLVAGYVWFDEPPQDFHAVFEAWLGGQWVMFDPTGMGPVDRVVRIGTGRDAKSVAFSTIFGNVQMTDKHVTVLEHDPRAPLTTREPAPAA